MASGTIKIGKTFSVTAPSGFNSVEGFVKNGVVQLRVVVNARSSGWLTNTRLGLPEDCLPRKTVFGTYFPDSMQDAGKLTYSSISPAGEFGGLFSQATSYPVAFTFVYPV